MKAIFNGENVSLTYAERRVLGRLCHDLTIKQIAHDLHVSPCTISSHLASIYEKFSVKSKLGAIVEGIRRGYLSIEPNGVVKIFDVNPADTRRFV